MKIIVCDYTFSCIMFCGTVNVSVYNPGSYILHVTCKCKTGKVLKIFPDKKISKTF